jgi:hypothetical protein
VASSADRRRRLPRRRILVLGVAAPLAACAGGGNGPRPPSPTGGPSPSPTATPRPTATATPSPTPPPTPTAAATPIAGPAGFPIDPATRTGLVSGTPGARAIAWGEGPEALAYSRDDQPSDDPERANRCGWNARVHLEYEGQPAVDWYVDAGTPVHATHAGLARLSVVTASNPFAVYAVDREPYIGNPDRARAPRSPFPGPGGGQGVFVSVTGEGFRTDYAHFDPTATPAAVPAGAWLEGFGPGDDLAALFADLRDYRTSTDLARWEVERGDVVGFTGDTGYSEAPHLHYAVRRAGSSAALCPTEEPGFADRGWLFRGS